MIDTKNKNQRDREQDQGKEQEKGDDSRLETKAIGNLQDYMKCCVRIERCRVRLHSWKEKAIFCQCLILDRRRKLVRRITLVFIDKKTK